MEELVRAIVEPMIANKASLMIKTVPSIDEKYLEVLVITDKVDTARLIGKGGSVASAIRKVVSVKSRLENTHIHVKFESYDE
ncbi:MAG: KH domain-containing protein [Erysipelotrichaceae bacterium]|nr:KH domain-containing protein [Erysipelotrichaceae bacterium]